MWTARRLFRLRCGIVSVVIIMAAVVGVLPARSSGGQTTVSLKLIQTISNAELPSSEPFSREGVLAVRAGDVVQLWDTRARTLRASLPRHEKILEAFFDGDGDTFITSSREKSSGLITRLWDAQTGRLKTTLSGLIVSGPATIESRVDTVVTLTDSDELKFWDARTGELNKTVPAHGGTFASSRISFDGRVVVRYGGKKGYLWEVGTGRLIAELTPPKEREATIPYYSDLKLENAWFSPDSRIVATKDSLNSIELWDARTGQLRALLQGHESTIYTATFSSNGRLLASASRDGSARVWDVETGRLRATLKAGKEIARRVVFNPAGTLLAVGYQTQARVWNVPSGQLQATLAPHPDVNRTVLFGTYLDAIEILFSPDGRFLVTVGNKSVKVWSTTTGELVTTLEGARAPVAFAPGDRLLATTGANGNVFVWAMP